MMAELQTPQTAVDAVTRGAAAGSSENDSLIASVTLARVGALLNQLHVTLPALQRVLERVACSPASVKRKRVAEKEETRPSKQPTNVSGDGGDLDGPCSEAEISKETAEGLDSGPIGPVKGDASNGQSRTAVGDDETPERVAPREKINRAQAGSTEVTNLQPQTEGSKDSSKGRDGVLLCNDVAVKNQPDIQQGSASLESLETPNTPGGGEMHIVEAVSSEHGDGSQPVKSDAGAGSQALLDRISDVLLTLSQLGRLRAGRPPTEVENNLMAEAYENVYLLASKVAPKDLISKKALDQALHSFGLRKPEPSLESEHAPITPKAANHIPTKVSPSVAAITAVAAREVLVKQGLLPSEVPNGPRPPELRSAKTPGAGPSTSTPPPSQTPARTPPPTRFGTPLSGQVTPAEAAAIALAAGQGKVLTELDQKLRASGQPPSWQVGVPTGLPDRKVVQRKIEAHLREQQQLMTQFRQVELIEQHVAGKREEVQQQLNSYLAQERELEDQSLSVLGEVQLKLSQLHQQAASLQTHHQQLVKAKKQVLQKHVAIQQEKQILATAPFLSPRSSVEFPVTCPVCQQQENSTPALIVCDLCERGYHIRCVLPPSTPPFPYEHDWICPVCKAQALQTPAAVPFQGGSFAGRASPLGILAASLGASVSAAPRLHGETGPWSGAAGAIRAPDSNRTVLNLLGSVERRRAKSRSASPLRAVADVSKAAPGHLGDVSRGGAILEGVVVRKPDGSGPSDKNATPPRGFDLEAGEARAKGEEAAHDVSRALDLLGGSDQAVGVRVSWGGEGARQEDGSVQYRECVLNRRTYRVGDTVELRSDAEAAPPFVGRIQALWEDPDSKQQRVRVNWCYAPSDIPAQVGKPEPSGVREVYESNHSDENPVGSILGPCVLLPQRAFESELERRRSAGIGTVDMFPPLYLCNWSYDARLGKFMAWNQET